MDLELGRTSTSQARGSLGPDQLCEQHYKYLRELHVPEQHEPALYHCI